LSCIGSPIMAMATSDERDRIKCWGLVFTGATRTPPVVGSPTVDPEPPDDVELAPGAALVLVVEPPPHAASRIAPSTIQTPTRLACFIPFSSIRRFWRSSDLL